MGSEIMDSKMHFSSRRSPVLGMRGMVAASQPLAVAAGLEALQIGGNAADAAVAAAAMLNLTQPTSTGIGGDCFALFYESATKKVFALNGSGRAPSALTLDLVKSEGLENGIPPLHPFAITVPGACAGWCDLIERFGRLDRARVLGPAIRLAESGFPVTPLTAHTWKTFYEPQLSRSPNGRELSINGRAPNAGEVFRNPGLARTLRTVAEGGKEAYYKGEIAEAMVTVVREAGGCLGLEDLASHTSTWESPLSTTYRDYRIWECPPNGQGLTALMGLNILEGYDLAGTPPLSAERLHLEIEALRLAFADTRWHVADPKFHAAPVEGLLSKEYARERRRLLDPEKAAGTLSRGSPASSSDTVYLSVVDGEGNACSFINSNYKGFGTGIVPRGWGFPLHNRGLNFSLDPAHPNCLAPGKRPYHTIIPGMITLGEDLFASFGLIGGFMQPQGHLQLVVSLIDDKADVQAALDLPRFCIMAEESGGRVALEEGIPVRVMAALAEMGHPVVPVSGYGRSLFGRGHIIVRDRESGVLRDGSEPRADGCAMCLI